MQARRANDGRRTAAQTAPRRKFNGRAGVLLAMAVALAVLVLAGCGGSAGDSTGDSVDTTAESGSESGGSLAKAEQKVSEAMKPITNYELPEEPISDVASLKGKTVMYVPLLQAAPAYQVIGAALTEALDRVGVTVKICDGEVTPTATSACIKQAINQKVAGIVTDTVPYSFAENAFKAAVAAKIPILLDNEIPMKGTEEEGKLQYFRGNYTQPEMLAAWLAVDSGGHGNLLFSEEAVSPSAISYINDYFIPALKKYCPECESEKLEVNVASPDKLASEISSKFLTNPDIEYYYGQFEFELMPALEALQQTNKTNSIKLLFATATLAGLQKMASGQAVYADSAVNDNYQGWALADTLLRMVTGQPAFEAKVPARLFTRDNVDSLELTPAAQADGSWFGDPALYKDGFEKVWGVK